jgi:hypothetical protein
VATSPRRSRRGGRAGARGHLDVCGLDTPFEVSIPTKAAMAAVRAAAPARERSRAAERLPHRGVLVSLRTRLRRALSGGLPLTSIYSRGDGVVWWEACTVPYAECVEVTGSHVGTPSTGAPTG